MPVPSCDCDPLTQFALSHWLELPDGTRRVVCERAAPDNSRVMRKRFITINNSYFASFAEREFQSPTSEPRFTGNEAGALAARSILSQKPEYAELASCVLANGNSRPTKSVYRLKW